MSTNRPSDIEALMASGQLVEAARQLLDQGEFRQAAGLFEQVWDFDSAARAYLDASDPCAALTCALRGQSPEVMARVRERLMDAPADQLQAAARCAEERGALALAGELHERGGHWLDAARCLERAGLFFEAARCLEPRGPASEAIRLYRRFLDQGHEPSQQKQAISGRYDVPRFMQGPDRELPRLTQDRSLARDEPSGAGRPPDVLAARLSLGRLLLRQGRSEEALPWLQQAFWDAADEPLARHAGRAIVAGLHRLGFRRAALAALDLLTERFTGPPVSLDDCLSDPDLAVASQEPRVLAGRYRLGELLGAGAMASVYEAQDLVLQRRVAVKLFAAPSGPRGREAALRFQREARVMGELHHPHVVSLLDVHEAQGFMVMEHLEGGTLARRLTGPLPLETCRTLLLQVLDGLAAAHQRGIIHRDIKPSNIFLTAAGSAKLGDFGVAHLRDSGLTQTGAFIGTLAYMSPEQIRGEPLTFACDLYALGVLLFHLVTGALPFSPPDLVHKHLHSPPPLPSQLVPGLPSQVDDLVRRCMAKAPMDRYESLEDLARAAATIPAWPGPAPVPPGTEAAPPDPAPSDDDRFQVLCEMATARGWTISRAQDRSLGRGVLLLRLAPEETAESSNSPGRSPPLTSSRPLNLLRVAAREGGPHLQRVLDLDEPAGHAVLQDLDNPVLEAARAEADMTQVDRVLRLRTLATALGPLHAAGLAHGALGDPTAGAILELGETTVIALVPALLVGDQPTPRDDIQALASRYGLELPADLSDAQGLLVWLAQTPGSEGGSS